MEVWTHWKVNDLFPESAASTSPSTPARLDHTHLTISWERGREMENEKERESSGRERGRKREREIYC